MPNDPSPEQNRRISTLIDLAQTLEVHTGLLDGGWFPAGKEPRTIHPEMLTPTQVYWVIGKVDFDPFFAAVWLRYGVFPGAASQHFLKTTGEGTIQVADPRWQGAFAATYTSLPLAWIEQEKQRSASYPDLTSFIHARLHEWKTPLPPEEIP